VTVRSLGEGDREWVRDTLRELWGETVVSRGAVHDPTALPGFVASGVTGKSVVVVPLLVFTATCRTPSVRACSSL